MVAFEKRYPPELPQKYYSNLWMFRKAFYSGLPILMYHHVEKLHVKTRYPFLYVSPRLFKKQMEEFYQEGFKSVPLGIAPSGQRVAKLNFAITFDDGFASVFKNAMKVLDQFGFKATVFVVVHAIGKTNLWDEGHGVASARLMDKSQIRDWLAAGHDIGSHSLTHPALTRVSLEEAKEEITASKKHLEDLFGRKIDHFAYPYGDHNKQIEELVIQAGYETISTTQSGLNYPTSSRKLYRLTARYPSRKWSHIIQRFRYRLFSS